jgi:ubiquinone/menaquinone biosynthesis C-methylase UbiE
VVCLDRAKEALYQTKLNLKGKTSKLELIHSRVQDMNLPENSIDLALWGNSIHYLDAEEQEEALTKVRHALKKGGWLFFNSAFYAESRPQETIVFYRAQVRRAVEYLKSKGIDRDRMDARPAASNFFSKEYYEDLVKKVGFSLVDVREKVVRLSGVAMEHISAFQEYAAGALHGYNPPDAAEAMKLSVASAMEQYGEPDNNGILAVRRRWLAISAQVI